MLSEDLGLGFVWSPAEDHENDQKAGERVK